MHTQVKNNFITSYNQKVPHWKRIYDTHLFQNRGLDKFINLISEFITDNNLDPKILVEAIVKFYLAKNNRYPNIFLFKGNKALNIYKNHKVSFDLDLSEIQKILISVKKSKILLENLTDYGIIYNRGVNFLHETGKADPYFLIAHGIREGISKNILTNWENDDKLKKLILNEILY